MKRLTVLIVAAVVVALVSMTGLTVTPPFVSVWDLIDNRIAHIDTDSIVVDTKLVVQATSTFDAPYKIIVDADSALMSKKYIDDQVGGGSDTSLFLSEAVGSGTRTVFWSNDSLFVKIGNDTILLIAELSSQTTFNAYDNTTGFLFNDDVSMNGNDINMEGGAVINALSLDNHPGQDLTIIGAGAGEDILINENSALRWTFSDNRMTGESGSLIIVDSIIINSDTLTLDHLPSHFMKLKVHNATGATLDKGTPVFISGATGDVPNADSARSDDSLQMPAVCILDEDIANGAQGFGIFAGDFHMFNTSGPGWSVGDPLYVAPTGGLTSTQPVAPNLIQKLGEVTRVNVSQGEIYVFGAGRSNDLPHFARFDLDMNDFDITGMEALEVDTIRNDGANVVVADHIDLSGNDILAGDSAGIASVTDGIIDGADLDGVLKVDSAGDGTNVVEVSPIIFQEGSNITLTVDANGDTLTIASTGGGGLWDTLDNSDTLVYVTQGGDSIIQFINLSLQTKITPMDNTSGFIIDADVAFQSNSIILVDRIAADTVESNSGTDLWIRGKSGGNNILIEEPAGTLRWTFTDNRLVGEANSYIDIDSLVVGANTIVNIAGNALTVTAGVLDVDVATDAVQGVATFNTANFAVTAGDVVIKAGGVNSNEIANNTINFPDIDYSNTLASSPTLEGGEAYFGSTGILFEGATGGAGNGFELLLWAEDPSSDDSLKLPALSGTLAVLANLADSISIKVDSAGDGTNVVAVHPIIFKEGSNITLTVHANGDTVTIAGPAASGTADSMSVDTDGDGTIDNYLYSTVAGAFNIKKGSNITLTVDTDTLIIAGPAASGTADSMGVDTDGDGTVDGYMYSTVAGAMHLKKGSAITLALGGDTTSISIATGAITSTHIAEQTIINNDIDTTAENFVFDGAFHITSAEADSAYVTAASISDTADVLRGEALWDSSIVKVDSILYQISNPYDTTIQIFHDTTGYAAGTDSTHFRVPDGALLFHGQADDVDTTGTKITAMVDNRITDSLDIYSITTLVVLRDGSQAMTADWSYGDFDLTGGERISFDTGHFNVLGTANETDTPLLLEADTMKPDTDLEMWLGTAANRIRMLQFVDFDLYTGSDAGGAYDTTDVPTDGQALTWATGGVINWQTAAGSGLWNESNDSTWVEDAADNDTTMVITDDDAGAVTWDIGADQSSLTIGAAGITTIDSIDNILLYFDDFVLYTGGDNGGAYDSTDVPSDGQQLTWNTGGTIDWQAAGSGVGFWDSSLVKVDTILYSLVNSSAQGGVNDTVLEIMIDTSDGAVYIQRTLGGTLDFYGDSIGLTSMSDNVIDSQDVVANALSFPSDIAAFTEAELEAALSDVTAVFTNNATGDVTVAGATSTIGTSTIDSLMLNQVEIGEWMLDTLAAVMSGDVTMLETGVTTISDNVIDTNHLATTNLAVDEEIMTFETGNSIEYHTPAELGLMLAADFADSADNHLDTAEVVTIHSDSGLASRDTIQFALTISAPNGFVQDTLVILKADASIYSDSIIFTELALETRQATTDSAWIEVWTDIDHTAGTETVIDTLGKTTTQSIEAGTFNARGAAQGSYVMLIVRLADASATEWHVRGSFWEKR